MTPNSEGVYFGTERSNASALTHERVRLALKIASFCVSMIKGIGKRRRGGEEVLPVRGEGLMIACHAGLHDDDTFELFPPSKYFTSKISRSIINSMNDGLVLTG